MKKIAVVLMLTFLSLSALTQNVKKIVIGNFLKSNHNKYYKVIDLEPSITGAALKIPCSKNFEDILVYSETDTFYVDKDEDGTCDENFISSNLLIWDSTPLHLTIEMKKVFPVELYLIYAGKSPKIQKLKSTKTGCEKPNMIDQSEWRKGLKSPDFKRIRHEVKNIIIHHTAGSNTATDYTNVVRNIYIFHTQVRKWSDIGYNYLIAQDGTIYKGRDPDIYEQDNVMGAHFCKANTNTMGISLLGNYEKIKPTPNAISSLVNLLAWKTAKDKLNPLGTNPHKLDKNLNIISGHRDGCSTKCPGNFLYQTLSDIRKKVNDKLNNCGIDLPIYRVGEKQDTKIYPNPTKGSFSLIGKKLEKRPIYIYNSIGQTISFSKVKISNNKWLVNINSSPGIYYLKIHGEEAIYKIVVMK